MGILTKQSTPDSPWSLSCELFLFQDRYDFEGALASGTEPHDPLIPPDIDA